MLLQLQLLSCFDMLVTIIYCAMFMDVCYIEYHVAFYLLVGSLSCKCGENARAAS